MKHYIYKLTDPITGQFYFGSRSHPDPENDSYMGSMVSWTPEDKSRLVKEIIKDDFETREDAIDFEDEIIGEYIDNPLNENYNRPHRGFHTLGLDVCSKDSFIKRYGKEEGIKRHTKWLNSIKNTMKQKMKSMSKEGRKRIFGQSGELNPNYGNEWSDDWKEGQSKRMIEYYQNNTPSNLGKKFDKTWRNNISESRIKNGIAKGSNNPNSYGNVKITDLDGNERVFDTAKEASKYYKVDRVTLTKHCKNKTSYQRGKLKGWRFEIIN